MSLRKTLELKLEQRSEKSLLRERSVRTTSTDNQIKIANRSLINFCSNDYLGLANHPAVISAANQAMQDFAVGSTGSALITGYTSLHQKLEEQIAEHTQREKALVFPSGYAANLGAINALVSSGDDVFMDRLSHASLIDGVRLSGGKWKRYQHCNVDHLQRLLSQISPQKNNPSWVITESLFSMDGDSAPLKEIAALCSEKDTTLYVDDAHGYGLFGQKGAGSLLQENLSQQEAPVLVATFGKALGVSGAFVAGSETLIDALLQFARSYIYTTAISPVLVGAVIKSLQLVESESWRQKKLFENIEWFKQEAVRTGLVVSDKAHGPIQPIMVGDSDHALKLSDHLNKAGYFVTAIRPPTVPAGEARLRITLSAEHELNQITGLVETIYKIQETKG